MIVSLFTREWIEIILNCSTNPRRLPSPSLRGSGLKLICKNQSIRKKKSPSLRGSGLKLRWARLHLFPGQRLPLYEGVDWNVIAVVTKPNLFMSPSLRGSGLKSATRRNLCGAYKSPSLRGSGLKFRNPASTASTLPVSLFTREWIEITTAFSSSVFASVSLFTREWIEIVLPLHHHISCSVSLFTREWIEISSTISKVRTFGGLPLYEGVDWNTNIDGKRKFKTVSLFTREWIEIETNETMCPGFFESPSLRGSGLK